MSIQDLVKDAVKQALEEHDSKLFDELKFMKEQMKDLKTAVDTLLRTKELDDADGRSVALAANAR